MNTLSSNHTRGVVVVATMVIVMAATALLVTSQLTQGNNNDDTTCASNDNINGTRYEYRLHPEDDRLLLYHFNTTSSTQDEAKIIAEELVMAAPSSSKSRSITSNLPMFVVTATSQSSGRGTSGRLWLGSPGNLFVTIGIPQSVWYQLKSQQNIGPGTSSISSRNVPLTLLPLKVGTEVAVLVSEKISSEVCRSNTSSSLPQPRVTVKWPNDVLVDERKISGTLIESSQHGDYFLVGIGINVAYKPEIPTNGPNHGRPATSIQDHCNSISASTRKIPWESLARQWGIELAYNLHIWFMEHSDLHSATMTNPAITMRKTSNNESADLAESIVESWKKWLDFDAELVMRDTDDHERVKIVNVLPDGRVEVDVVSETTTTTWPRRKILVSDYFL